MSSQNKQEIKLREDSKVFVDQKTNARTIATPFKLPDGTNAVIMICRLKDEKWIPQRLIEKVIIQYK